MSKNHLSTSEDAFLALALEPRIMFDAAAVETVAVTVEATEAAPGVTASGTNPSATVDETNTSATVDLFSDVSVSTDTGGDELDNLVIKVDSSGIDQALIIDGTTVVLEAGSGSTANNNYAYSVEIVDGQAVITLSLASSPTGYDAASAAALIDGLSYSVLDSTVDTGPVNVTLTSLSDEGGQEAELNITSSVDVVNDRNLAPEVESDGSLIEQQIISISALGAISELTYSQDGKYVFAANGNGDLAVFEVAENGALSLVQSLSGVTDVGSVTDMAASNDALYVISGGNIVTLSVGEGGQLTYSATTSIGDTGVDLSLSSDGTTMIVGTQWNGLYIYAIDTSEGADGAFTQVARFTDNVDRSAHSGMSGDYLYVIGSGMQQTLVVYQRTGVGEDMVFTQLDSINIEVWNWATNYADPVVSSDGSTVYITDRDQQTVSAFKLIDGSLTQMDSKSVSGVASVALSDDGESLYVTTSSGNLTIYSVGTTGALTLAATIENAGANSVVVSGGNVLVAGSGSLARYSETVIYTVEGDPAPFGEKLTLSDSNLDALSDGAGNYNGASIIIDQSVDGVGISSGLFGFTDGDGLTLSGNEISLNGEVIASFTVSDGVLTVSFSADTTTEVANQVLQKVTYANDSLSPDKTVALGVIVDDGELQSEKVNLSLDINIGPKKADLADGYTVDTVTTETAYSFTLDSGLFEDADGDSLTWTIEGLPDGLTFDPEILVISGTTTAVGSFTLNIKVTDGAGSSATTEVTLTVDQIDNRAPVVSESAPDQLTSAVAGADYSETLDADMFFDADGIYGDELTFTVADLPDGLSFDAETLTISGNATGGIQDHTITITVSDGSGQTVSHDVTLRVISQSEADNAAPVVSGDTSDLAYSADGDLSGFDQYVDDLALSDDGTVLVVVANSDRNGTGTSYLNVYARDTETGALTLLQSFTQGTVDDANAANGIEVDGLSSITSVAFSADGKHLYVTGITDAHSDGTTYSISAFSVGGDGSLTAIGQLSDLSEKILEIEVSDDGKTLYALSDTSLYSYSVDGSGDTLSLIDTEAGADFSGAIAMEIDAQGTVYVLSSSRVTIFSTGSDSTLTYQGQVGRDEAILNYTDGSDTVSEVSEMSSYKVFSGARDFVVSDDGGIYIVNESSYLTILKYSADTNSVEFVQAEETYGHLVQFPDGVGMSADGTAVYVISGGTSTMVIYRVAEDGSVAFSNKISTSGAGTQIAVSTDGSSIYVGQNKYFSTGLRQLNADGLSTSYIEGETTQIASGIHLSDTEYDLLDDGSGNYNGATLSFVRDGGANAEDVFGFADGNGLVFDGTTITLNDQEIATLSSVDGTATITFTGDATKALANEVVQRVTYTNTSDAPDSAITMVVSLKDQYASGVGSVKLTLSVTSVNDAPRVTGSGVDGTFDEGDSDGVSVFDGISIDPVEEGDGIKSFTVTITGVENGSTEKLIIHDTEISLVETSYGSTTDWNYSYSVTVAEDGTVTVIFDTSTYDANYNRVGSSAETVSSMINNITYKATGDDVVSGTRTITLSAVQDDGGTDEVGADTATLSIAATLDVTGINDAPVVTATPTDVTYTEGASDPVSLFTDTDISTVEKDQLVDSFTLTVSNVQDGGSEILTIDGTDIALQAGIGTTTNGYSYEVTITDNVATVTVSSADGMTAQAVSSVVDGITYQNTSSDTTLGDRTVTLTAVQDNGGTSDGGVDTATLSIAATVTVAEVNDAPTVSTTPTNPAYNEGGEGVALFEETDISTVESDQGIISLTITATGIEDGAKETLTIDGSEIALEEGSGTTTSGYSYTVTLEADNSLTIVVSSDTALTVAQANELIDTVTYQNAHDDATAGDRTFALSALQDDGGTLNGGVDTAALDITSTVSVQVVNDAPVVSVEGAGGNYKASGNPVVLFENAAFSTVEAGQGFSEFLLSIEGVSDSNEVLIIDGTKVSLIDGETVQTQGNLRITVTFDGDVAQVSITSTQGLSAESAQTLVNEMAYANESDTVSTGTRTFSLISAKDIGGSANGGVDTTTMNVDSTIEVVNSAPQVASSGAVLNTTAGVSYQVSIPSLFTDADGEVLTFEVEGLPDGLVFDAETLTLQGTFERGGTHSFSVLARDGAGETVVQEFSLVVRESVDHTPPTQNDPIDPSVGSDGPLLGGDDPVVDTGVGNAGAGIGGFDFTSFGAVTTSVADGLLQGNLGDGFELSAGQDTGLFEFSGSQWSAVVSAADGQGEIPLQLPENIKGQGVRLSLENGMPLPNWVRFDPVSGKLSIDSQRMNEAGQLNIRVQFRDGDGALQETRLEIQAQAEVQGAQTAEAAEDAEEAPRETVSETDGASAPEVSQRQSEPSLGDGEGKVIAHVPAQNLVDEIQDLLADLAGLNTGDAAADEAPRSVA
ncbi:putative Ig domain-containing protein [Terasakiella pusilla]|uniref:putative Ig domain-containing protein n=1 Tax=Terasakiella pusilla TaxID=64973 RepID=UPI003AA88B26